MLGCETVGGLRGRIEAGEGEGDGGELAGGEEGGGDGEAFEGGEGGAVGAVYGGHVERMGAGGWSWEVYDRCSIECSKRWKEKLRTNFANVHRRRNGSNG